MFKRKYVDIDIKAPTKALLPDWMSKPLPIYGGCQFPLWNNKEAPTMQFCDRERKADSPYCPIHHAICYTRPAPKGSAALKGLLVGPKVCKKLGGGP